MLVNLQVTTGVINHKEGVTVAQRDLCGPSTNTSGSNYNFHCIVKLGPSKQTDARSAAVKSDQEEVRSRGMVVCS